MVASLIAIRGKAAAHQAMIPAAVDPKPTCTVCFCCDAQHPFMALVSLMTDCTIRSDTAVAARSACAGWCCRSAASSGSC